MGKKSLICLEAKSMTHLQGNTIILRSSRQLFPDSHRALLPELQRNKDTIRCAALGTEVPGHRQEQLTKTLIVRLLKTHFFTPILDCEKSTE